MTIQATSRAALLILALSLMPGCIGGGSGGGDDDDSAVDSEDDPPSFDSSGVWPEVDCSGVDYYWGGNYDYAIRFTPPEPPWQLTGVSAGLVKLPSGQSCIGGPLEVVALVTPDPLPSMDMIPLLDDVPTALVTLAEPSWADLEPGMHVLEETLDEPLLVEQEGDLYLVVSIDSTGGEMNCLPGCMATSDNHSFYRAQGPWESLQEGPGQSTGLTATIEY